MAALDKTYVHSWEDYCKVRDWANSHTIIYSDGEEVSWSKIFRQVTEEEFNEYDLEWGFPIWNTSQYEDAILFRDCSLDIVQNRLKTVYLNPEKDLIIEPQPEYKVATKFKVDYSMAFNHIHYYKSRPISIKIIDREGNTCSYFPKKNQYNFFNNLLRDYWSSKSNVNYISLKGKSIKAIIRALRKYNIPSGYKVIVLGRYIAEDWIIKCY